MQSVTRMATTPPLLSERKQIFIRGVVQGVGFRPFVYNLAQSLGLSGYILNSSAGVTVEIEGADRAIQQFLHTLQSSPPPLAQITDVAVKAVSLQGEKGFSIRESRAQDDAFVLVSPDVATCDDCWHEFGDPSNRRYGYPF
ncbi:MAG: acylphosphatase, partial [Acidobacteriaceae bacterium]